MAETRTQLSLTFTMLAAVCLNGTAHGITLLSQTRSVSADATLDCGTLVDASSQSSTAAGSFIESVSETVSGAESNASGGFCIEPVEEISGAASQNTLISSSIISGFGSASAGKANGAFETGLANGSSQLSVTFNITSSSSYALSGEVAGEEVIATGGYFPGDANVSLWQGSSLIHSVDPNAPDPTFGGGSENAFAFSGTLAPGVYTLTASATAMATGPLESSDMSSFTFTFVPEPSGTLVSFCGLLSLLGFRRCRK